MSISILFSYALLIGGIVLPLLVLGDILRARRSPAATMAWTIGVIMLPYVAVPLYFVFAGRKLPTRIRRRKDPLDLDDELEIADDGAHEIDRLLRRLHLPGATSANDFSLHRNPVEAYEALVALIEGAQRSIHISVYIFSDDEVGSDILGRLTRRAGQGIDVRLLVDGVGSLDLPDSALATLVAAGGRAARFNQLLAGALRGLVNLRNHRKIAVADGFVAWSGGRNIARRYLAPRPAPYQWTDLSFTINGPAAHFYQQIFYSDWAFATGTPPETPQAAIASAKGHAVVQVTPSGPDVPDDPYFSAVLAASFSARRRLWMATPYFTPDESLQQAWVMAARLGVDVRIVVPDHSDSRILDVARMSYLRELQAAGASVLRHTGPVLHMKAFVIDDSVAGVGSANMDWRSMFTNFEAMALLYSEPEIVAVSNAISTLFADCRKGVPGVGRYRGMLSGATRMLAPLL